MVGLRQCTTTGVNDIHRDLAAFPHILEVLKEYFSMLLYVAAT